ncbi:hemolysin [Novimethylophilus kurashikiensis]|uniref:L-ornithine N(alpha)-acyltransferase n=1 Tax=Novimethylophilus kurashikiensis TaxID=1825523 RepID=A0A2R5F448_9PROT|nr:GNAT family N-acyltransferase [Novimethylophilus kurashikiensis]GBG13207.1 hemolysin [Novimethylophilus kurashikiensis]
MLQQIKTVAHERTRPSLHYSFARTPAEVMEAQRLRYKVFAEEMGAKLSGHDGLDRDGFDAFCEHLLVRDVESGKVVGTYRILDPQMAGEAGGYYSAGEFDLTRLMHLSPSMVELGRACVHRDYRSGATISLLWAGLAKFMVKNGYEYLIGCASIGMADGGHMAANLYEQLKDKHLAPVEYRVFPRCRLPIEALQNDMPADSPALLKGYLRLGAYICGEPHWDPDFNAADLLIMLPLARMNRRYADHFLK